MTRKPWLIIALSGIAGFIFVIGFVYWIGMNAGKNHEQAAEATRQAQAAAEAREQTNEVLESYQNIDDSASGIDIVDWLRDSSKTFFLGARNLSNPRHVDVE